MDVVYIHGPKGRHAEVARDLLNMGTKLYTYTSIISNFISLWLKSLKEKRVS
jgi:hypothetical protein